MTDTPHWARQGRGEDGRFMGFVEDVAPSSPARSLPGKFGGAAPDSAVEPATWVGKKQRQLLEQRMPDRYKPYDWGGSAQHEAARRSLESGADPDAVWRLHGAVDPIHGRTPDGFRAEKGEPLLYLPDADWSRQAV